MHEQQNDKKQIAFMPSSCPAFHSPFIIAIVYQHGGGCVPQNARQATSSPSGMLRLLL